MRRRGKGFSFFATGPWNDGFVTFRGDIHLMDDSVRTDFSLERLRQGDQDEFARLVDAFSGPIYRLGLRMLGNQPDAEDVLQNTFLNALTHLPGFEGRSSLSTWLYRIAANEALMLIRRKKPEVELDQPANEIEPVQHPKEFADWSGLPEDELLSQEGKRAVDEAIESLPEAMRIVFVLRDIEGLSIQETAEALGLSEGNVKTRLLRARLKLRERLSAYYGERLIGEGENG